jgi:hypothetical protein
MTSRTPISTFNARVDVLLLGIPETDLTSANRDIAARHAVQGYNRDLPRRETYEFAGDAGNYYLLWGKTIAIVQSDRDAGIDFQGTSLGSSTDEKLSVAFTTDYEFDLHQVNLLLSRIGATVGGTIQAALYTASGILPSVLIATSVTVEIDEEEGAPPGYYRWVEFPFADPVRKLPAGDYCVVLEEGTGYTYASGTNEVNLGVDQSSVINTVGTYNGTVWAAYGTDSAGMLEVLVSIPDWQRGLARITDIEYPAAAIASNERPVLLEDDEFDIYTAQGGDYLHFPNLAPAAADNIRLRFTRPYMWVESSTDPDIDTPVIHFEAICNLAASVACLWLAVRYGQNTDSSIGADVVQHQQQHTNYATLAKKFQGTYMQLTGLRAKEGQPAAVMVDLDITPAHTAGDFMFHGKRTR